MSALYIGAGTDTDPITKFPDIKTFYYVDCQPNSEFGVNYSPGFARPKFIPNLNKKMTDIGMKFINSIDDIRTYSNGDQTVHYYTNTSIPEHNDRIKLLEYDTLIVAGHHPHHLFLDNNNYKLKFIGFQGTVYSKEEQETLLSRSYITNKIIVQNIESDMILINRMFTPFISEYKDKPFYKVTDNDNIKNSIKLDGKILTDGELKIALNDNTAIFEVTTENKKTIYFENRDLMDASETENINWKLHYSENIRNRFSTFKYIHREENNKSSELEQNQTFNNWFDFVKYADYVLKTNRDKRRNNDLEANL